MDVVTIEQKLKKVLTESRYLHTLRVRDTAKKLSGIFNVDQKKVEYAALLHDYAKCMPKEELKTLIQQKCSIELLDYHHELWHGPVAAELIQEEFHVSDGEIINSVRYHTTGRSGMSLIEKIIYVSDYIEPARSFPHLDEVRIMAETDLTRAAYLVSRNSLVYLLNQGQLIHPTSIQAYNDLQRQVYGGV